MKAKPWNNLSWGMALMVTVELVLWIIEKEPARRLYYHQMTYVFGAILCISLTAANSADKP